MSTITTTSPETASPLKRLIRHHPLIAYFVIAFAGPWLFNLPAMLARNGLGLLPFTVPFLAFVGLFLLGNFAGPTLGAFVVTAITDGKPGIRQLLRRCVQWRVGLGWYLLVIFGYPLLFLLDMSLWLGPAPLSSLLTHWPLIFTSYLPSLLGFGTIIIIGEEPGWRGFALPRLQRQYGPLPGSLILGTLHGIWHLPIFIIASFGLAPFNPVQYGLNILGLALITIIWTWLFNNANGSILFAILVHDVQDAKDGLLNQLVPVVPSWYAHWVYGWVAIVVSILLILIFTKGRLSYKPERAPQLVEVPQPAEMPQTNVEG
jgi:membrane protease YdiL (CAAX protease family)